VLRSLCAKPRDALSIKGTLLEPRRVWDLPRTVHPKFGRPGRRVHATLEAVGEEPEMYVFNFSDAPGAAERREQCERARNEARRRYHDYLAAVFDLHTSADPGAGGPCARCAHALALHR
jgi:hypothetical protein